MLDRIADDTAELSKGIDVHGFTKSQFLFCPRTG
jgi:hypothetical protein